MTEPHTVVAIPASPRRPPIETDSTTMAPPHQFVSSRRGAQRGAKAAAAREGETQFKMDGLDGEMGKWGESPC